MVFLLRCRCVLFHGGLGAVLRLTPLGGAREGPQCDTLQNLPHCSSFCS